MNKERGREIRKPDRYKGSDKKEGRSGGGEEEVRQGLREAEKAVRQGYRRED